MQVYQGRPPEIPDNAGSNPAACTSHTQLLMLTAVAVGELPDAYGVLRTLGLYADISMVFHSQSA